MGLESVIDGLEFFNLKIKCLNGKLSVDVYSKPTNSSAYVMPSTCYLMENINKVPKGIDKSVMHQKSMNHVLMNIKITF